MRRFLFPLETVRRWRESQLELQQAKLQALSGELRSIQARLTEIAAAKAAAEREVLRAAVVEGQQLAALEVYRVHLGAQKERLERQAADCTARIAAQRQRVLEAQRDLQLIEKLKQRRRAEWESEFHREQEALAADVFLARWNSR